MSIDRMKWAVETMSIGPSDEVLEIGCGRGLAVGLVCEKLSEGHITALDRSQTMVEAAVAANAEHIRSGKATIVNADLLDAALPARQFDKIFLFNINTFWMDPRDELAAISRLLKPNGRFYLFHQPPPGHEPAEFIEKFRSNLETHGFEVLEVLRQEFEPVSAVGLISQPIRR